MAHRAAHSGSWGKRGGIWNSAWHAFFDTEKFKNAKDPQNAVLKFGAQMYNYFMVL